MKIDIEKLVEKYDLGKIVKLNDYSEFSGALNKVYFLKTSENRYLIKKLNPKNINPSSVQEYNITEKIAEAFYRINIPSIVAVKFNKSFINKINNNFYIIYPFIEAKYIIPELLSEHHIKTAAKLLAKIHKANLTINNAPTYLSTNNEKLIALIEKTNLDILKKNISLIIRANKAYLDALPYAKKKLVISHRDLHAKNILWDNDQNPHIIDWETAGLINPYSEMIGYGLEWAGLYHSVFSEDKYILFLSHYKYINDFKNLDINKLLDVYIGNAIINWLEFNIKRIIIPESYDIQNKNYFKKEYEIGLNIITNGLIPYLKYFEENKVYFYNLINKCINQT